MGERERGGGGGAISQLFRRLRWRLQWMAASGRGGERERRLKAERERE